MNRSKLILALFFKFLKDNNALVPFLVNFYINKPGNRKNTVTFSKNSKYYHPGWFIDSAFHWEDTLEGRSFWSDLQYKWQGHFFSFFRKIDNASRPKIRNICKLYGLDLSKYNN